jgi:hypothetical protein
MGRLRTALGGGDRRDWINHGGYDNLSRETGNSLGAGLFFAVAHPGG